MATIENNVLKSMLQDEAKIARYSTAALIQNRRLIQTEYSSGPLIREIFSDLKLISQGRGAQWAAMSLLYKQLGPWVNSRSRDWNELGLGSRYEGWFSEQNGTFVSGKALDEYEAFRRSDVLNTEREQIIGPCIHMIEQQEFEAGHSQPTDEGINWLADMADLMEADGAEVPGVDREHVRITVARTLDRQLTSRAREPFTLLGTIESLTEPQGPQQYQLEAFCAMKKISMAQAMDLANKARQKRIDETKAARLAMSHALLKELRYGVCKSYTRIPDILPGWLTVQILWQMQTYCIKQMLRIDERVESFQSYRDDGGNLAIYQNQVKRTERELRALAPPEMVGDEYGVMH